MDSDCLAPAQLKHDTALAWLIRGRERLLCFQKRCKCTASATGMVSGLKLESSEGDGEEAYTL